MNAHRIGSALLGSLGMSLILGCALLGRPSIAVGQQPYVTCSGCVVSCGSYSQNCPGVCTGTTDACNSKCKCVARPGCNSCGG